MGYKVQFESGQTVEFDAQPTDVDIEEAYAHVSKTSVKTPVPSTPSAPGAFDNIGTGIKQAFAGVGNAADTGLSMLAGGAASLFGQTDDADTIYRSMNEREKSRNQWANPDDVKVGMAGKVAGAVATLPQQLLTFPLSAFTTGKTAVDSDESLGRVLSAQGLDVAGNMLGSLIGPGKTIYNSIEVGFVRAVCRRHSTEGRTTTTRTTKHFI